jgi:hypothetical protein
MVLSPLKCSNLFTIFDAQLAGKDGRSQVNHEAGREQHDAAGIGSSMEESGLATGVKRAAIKRLANLPSPRRSDKLPLTEHVVGQSFLPVTAQWTGTPDCLHDRTVKNDCPT